MNIQDAIGYIGTIDNASGQMCQMKDGKPHLLLFDLGCPNCSEVESRNADDMGEALMKIVNAAPDLLTALEQAHQDTCSLHCPSVWKTGEPQPHSDRCTSISAVLDKARD